MTDQPRYRSDNVGTLARAVISDPPDFTAVPALLEALEEGGEYLAALQVKQLISDIVHGVSDLPELVDAHMRVGLLDQVGRQLRQGLEFLIYDYSGTCDYLHRVIGRLTGADQVQEAKKELTTFRIRVPEHVRQGSRVPIDAVRQGIVISGPDKDGFADVVEAEADQYAENGMIGQMGPMIPRIRRR